ncbi:hypothetical protein [Paenibacillus sp. 481]|uniref:hypothetical protein n=1 Tax=Paenibacillus sp. 481 TaxID=2835869 RepID=UPI001E3C3850|nr:hypothetical protein [Paenibacillus sp. 481]UHA74732.1 hypothetical protein KIK04_06615 [Paenibacillus sp. 481]
MLKKAKIKCGIKMVENLMDSPFYHVVQCSNVSAVLVWNRQKDKHTDLCETDWSNYVLVVERELTSSPDQCGSVWDSICQMDGETSRVRFNRIRPERIMEWCSSSDAHLLKDRVDGVTILKDTDAVNETIQQHFHKAKQEAASLELLSEFACWLQMTRQSRRLLQQGMPLDAYHKLEEAFCYWARIVVLEHGEKPELAIWQQVKSHHLGIYKMYEELSCSTETLAQRVELALLACEFSLTSKAKQYCEPLLSWLRNEQLVVSLIDIQQHFNYKNLHDNLPVLLHKLVKRGYLQERLVEADADRLKCGLVPVYSWIDQDEA